MPGPEDPPKAGPGSVTEWIAVEKAGGDASREIWERYIDHVVAACEARLTANQRRAVSGADLAQEVFRDFFIGLRAGAFPKLCDRGDVRQILDMLAARTAIDHRRRHVALKAGAGRVIAFADIEPATPGARVRTAFDCPDRDHAPGDEAEVRRRLESLAPELSEPTLQDLACDRIMGFTIGEIAARNGLSPRTVIRKLQLLVRRLEARGLAAS